MFEQLFKTCLLMLTIIFISVLLIKRFIYFQPSSVFIPYKETYQDIYKEDLHGWFIGNKKQNKPTVFICHGNAGNISYNQNLIDSIVNLGYSVMIFDYSGYGRSKGIPSEYQVYIDASVFMEMLLQFTSINNIIIYGESIGAPIGAYIARKYQIKIFIIDSGLPSIKKYIKNRFSYIGKTIGFLFPEFDTEKHITGYKGNLLVMHSLTDEIIPYKITDFIRHNATDVIIITGTHNDKIIPWEKVNSFIKKLIK